MNAPAASRCDCGFLFNDTEENVAEAQAGLKTALSPALAPSGLLLSSRIDRVNYGPSTSEPPRFSLPANLYSSTFGTAQSVALLGLTLAAAAIDWLTYIIPNYLILCGALVGTALPIAFRQWRHLISGVLAALVVLLLCAIAWQKDFFGGGDVKLAAVCALFLGPIRSVTFGLVAGLLFAAMALLVRSELRPYPGGWAFCLAAAAAVGFHAWRSNRA